MGACLLVVYVIVLATCMWLRTEAWCQPDENDVFSDIPDYELAALKDLFDSTNGTGWNWCTPREWYSCVPWHFDGAVNPCSEKWQGVGCKNISDQTHIFTLELSNMYMFGTIPPSIGNLTDMCRLNLHTNLVEGTVPSQMGQLASIQELDISDNNFRGQIPGSLGSLEMLEDLYFYSNKFTGGIPAELGNMKNLQSMYLFYNSLNGTIPPELGRLSNLIQLQLYSNHLIGTIPPELCWMQNLNMLMLSGNKLSGPIPENIGNMTMLNEITFDNCGLNGSIPASISQLSHMNYLYLEDNEFTGTLPEDLGRMFKTYVMHLSNNHFRGSLPASIGNMSRLNDFQASYNELTGPVPASLINCSLETLDLSFNQLSQQLPNIFAMPTFFRVILSNNRFTGTLPPDYTVNLQLFEVNHNLLSKHLPPALFACWRLTYLYLLENQFTGSIPPEVNLLSHVTDLELDNNQLSGRIPGLLSNMTRLGTFALDNNHLTGEIPRDVGHLRVLLNLLLSKNYLSGTLPEEVSHLRGMTIFSVNNNLLTGSIPPVMSQLNSLTIFFVYRNIFTGVLDTVFDATLQKSLLYVDVSNNQFTGNLPLEVFRLPGLFSFAGVGNCFSGSIPSDVCGAVNLSALALDGLMSATNCQMRFFPKWTSSYGLPNSIKGGFPDCLFAMPRLTSLHLSGNGLTGTISKDVVISKSLADLSLSHNNIKGEIPPQLQLHNFSNLDLSYNKFRGTLDAAIYATYGRNGSLAMQVNRLSGKIPAALRTALDVTILDGNLYQCNAARTDLPQHDGYADIYECGSNTFNYVLYFWMAVVFLVAAVVVASWLLLDCSAWVKLCREWMRVFHYTNMQLDNIVSFGDFVAILRRVSVGLTLVIVLVCLPTFLLLSHYYDTYNYEYAWVTTGCYLSGEVATAVLLLLFILMGVCIVYCMYLVQQKTLGTQKNLEEAEDKTKEDNKWSYLQYGLVSLLVLFNLVLVTTVNILYVYVDHNYSSGIVRVTQLTVAMFKIVWKNLIVRLLLRVASPELDVRSIPKKSIEYGRESMRASMTLNDTASKGHNLSLAVFVTIFNNIAAPFIATCYVSTTCFYNVVSSPPKVTVSYEYAMCAYGQFNGNYTACNAFGGVEIHETSYDPPFIYSFQCSSTFITTYSSIYVFMFTMEAFFIPFVMWCLAAYHQRYGGHRPGKNKLLLLLESMIPKILQSVRGIPSVELMSPTDSLTSNQVDSTRATDQSLALFAHGDPHVPYFECAVFIVKLLNMFSILCTFGVILPPVAVVCCLAVLSATWSMQLFMGRFIVNAGSVSGAAGLIQLVEEDANHAAWMFLDSIWMLAPFCVIFFALFLFDVIGDAVGWKRALWAPLLIFCGSGLVWLVYRWKRNKWVVWWEALVKRGRQGMQREVTSDGSKVKYSDPSAEYAPLSIADDGMMAVLTHTTTE